MHKEVGDYLLRLELPTLVTISKVEVTPDLKWCKVWVTILGEEKTQVESMKRMKDDLPDMQKQLNHKLKMKFVPKISFVVDHGEEYASRINELLKKTHEE